MKVKELIEHLEKIYKEHGNLSIWLRVNDDHYRLTGELYFKPELITDYVFKTEHILLCADAELLY